MVILEALFVAWCIFTGVSLITGTLLYCLERFGDPLFKDDFTMRVAARLVVFCWAAMPVLLIYTLWALLKGLHRVPSEVGRLFRTARAPLED